MFIGYSEDYLKDKDRIDLHFIKNNIIKSYIIGKNIIFLEKQLRNKIKFSVTRNLKNQYQVL